MSVPMVILSIDPGAAGGIVEYEIPETGLSTRAVPMPPGESEIAQFIFATSLMGPLPPNRIAIVEDQTGCAGIRVSAPAMFKFGRHFGFLLGTLQARGFTIHLIKPQKWQKILGLGTSKGLTKTQWKNKLKDMAARLYPNIRVTSSRPMPCSSWKQPGEWNSSHPIRTADEPYILPPQNPLDARP